MKRQKTVFIIIAICALLIAVGYYFVLFHSNGVSEKMPPLIGASLYSQDAAYIKISQGATFQENYIITSFTDKEILIPIEGITLSSYNDTLWENLSVPQEKVFNYTFSPTHLTIEPYATNSSVLTIQMAQDAPIGKYRLSITLGNSQLTHLQGDTIFITVTNPQIDSSWVETVNNLLKTYETYPNQTQYANPEVTLSACNMYLVENGSEQLIYYGNGDPLSVYLGELLKKTNIQKNAVSEGYLDKVLANDRVIILNYRLSILHMIDSDAKYYAGYFILEDNLSEDLDGNHHSKRN